MYKRFVEPKVSNSLLNSPATLITGPRQSGKTTLAKKFQDSDRQYLSFDNLDTLNHAKQDPMGFIRTLDLVILDEIQRVPELFLAIKSSIDDDRRYGRFLLTGSANILEMPEMGDSLVGRIRQIELLPLAQAEILGNTSTFLENLFEGNFTTNQNQLILGNDLIQITLAGGFPEHLDMSTEERQDWAKDYVDFTMRRDLPDIAVILSEVPDVADLLSQWSGKLINYRQIGENLEIDPKTTKRYIRLLERLYLIKLLRPFHTRVRNQLAKTPKIHFLDTGLLSTNLGLDFKQLKANRNKFGSILETFVFSEIIKLTVVSPMRLKLYHFRRKSKYEVDVVLKRNDGMVVGVEVKSSATIYPEDFKGLKDLCASCQDQFAFGAILYDGDRVNYYGEKLAAVPISALWT